MLFRSEVPPMLDRSTKPVPHARVAPMIHTQTACGNIVQKLPYNLQERWLSHGSRFKENFNVPFPPFDYFVKFVCQQAKMRNDPSFSLTASSTEPTPMRKSAPKYDSPISVHKTDVSPSPRHWADSQACPASSFPQPSCRPASLASFHR